MKYQRLPTAEIVNAVASEIGTKRPLDLTIDAPTVFQLTGLMQLALRHPGLSDGLRLTAEHFLAGVREYFADCPTVLDVVRRGDDPAEDVP